MIAMNLQRLPAASERAVVGSHGVASPGKSVGLKVHNVAWSAVGADGTLRQALAAAMERARLQSLVGQPLPSEAESSAVAAKTMPPVVPDLPATALAAAPGPGPATTTAATPGALTAATVKPARAAPAAPAAPATPPAQPTAAESAKRAVDAVNQLRGLFGR